MKPYPVSNEPFSYYSGNLPSSKLPNNSVFHCMYCQNNTYLESASLEPDFSIANLFTDGFKQILYGTCACGDFTIILKELAYLDEETPSDVDIQVIRHENIR